MDKGKRLFADNYMDTNKGFFADNHNGSGNGCDGSNGNARHGEIGVHAATRIAVVFAGQGAQRPGMGRSLYERSAAARAVIDSAGEGIRHDLFDADAERLRQTEVTQPAVFTMDMAAYAAFIEALGESGLCGIGIGQDDLGAAPPPGSAPAKIGIAAMAGFSLGEYAAFVAAGAIGDFQTGLSIVRQRSLLMKEAGRHPDGSPRGAMAAAMGGVDAVLALVERARGGDVLEAVNFNAPTQTVIAGDAEAVARFADAAKQDRALGVKAVPLPVSGAFHTPIMAPASEGLALALAGHTFFAPRVPVFLNLTGESMASYGGTGGIGKSGVACADASANDGERGIGKSGVASPAAGAEDGKGGLGKASVASPAAGMDINSFDHAHAILNIRGIMCLQAKSPVLWQRTVENIAALGVGAFVEVGPGKTLTGLTKKILPDAAAFHVEDAESLDETIAALKKAAS